MILYICILISNYLSGAELDSDQFGSQIMFHAAEMNTREVMGRLENTEFTWAGQAFRLARYPINFHMNGDLSGSYVKYVVNINQSLHKTHVT